MYDAVDNDPLFGENHGLVIQNGGLRSNSATLDLTGAFILLSTNDSVADPFTGESWAERVTSTVHLENDNIVHTRTEVRVDATTSSESSRVVTDFEEMIGSADADDGRMRSNLAGDAQIHITGDLVALQYVLDGLNASQLSSTAISFAVSFLVLFILTRRIVPAGIVLTPVLLATLWVVGSMAVLGLKWNVLTVMVTALSLGIGIDYSIHMWRRFEAERLKTDDPWKALEETVSTTGIALVLSAGTTALGFLVLLLSPMPVVQQFGLVTALTVTFSLGLTVVVMPVLLIMAENQSGTSGK